MPTSTARELDDTVVLITGAARGQGRAHALTMARHGANVIAVDIADQIETVPYPMGTADDLAATVQGVEELGRKAIGVVADARSQEQIDEAVRLGLAQFGQLDFAIINHGIWSLGSFWELSDQQWTEMVETNLSSVWRTAKAVAPHMIERQTGSIVMVSSSNGLEPALNYAHYVAAKHGVIGLMRSVALELAPHGIRCNALCPGAIDTEMVNWQGAYDMFHGGPGGTRDDLLRGGRHTHALKGASFLDPQVMADAALWLLSEGSRYVTGTAIPIDAGHRLLIPMNPNPVE